MNYRSTNVRFVHFGGDVSANVESSHGVQLSGGSTGGIVQAIGDDANVSLTVRGQGTGGVTIGNSSQAVSLAGSGVTLTAGLSVKGIYSTTFAWTVAATSSGQFAEITLSTAVGDINPGDLVCVTPSDTMAGPYAFSGFRQSTTASSRLTILVSVPGSTATSTLSGTGRITWIDLT